MIESLKITAVQINPTVGDLAGNQRKIQAIWDAQDALCDLIVFPEMCLTGYPLEDLVLRPSFIADVRIQLEAFVAANAGKQSAILIGAPWDIEGKLYNAMFLIEGGSYRVILKHDLPNYGVFDEVRIFEAGPMPDVTVFRGNRLGIMICWDFWTPEVAAHLKAQGAECLIVPNGSTYETTKHARRIIEAQKRVTETGLPLLYVNLVGGQDELVFDGASFSMDGQGNVTMQMAAFEEQLSVVDFDKDHHCERPTGAKQSRAKGALPWIASSAMPPRNDAYPKENKAIYSACVLGLRDYVRKSGFSKVLLGLSGGIDSALTAVMAVDALGAENVHCVLLPSPFTSDHSIQDALELAENLGVSHETISIEPAMAAFGEMIEDLSGLAHENMQARARGVTLMSLSNQSGALLLSTGNKSEIAVGYSTLYGDMCGAFNPLKDLYKTRVFALSRLRNEWKPNFGLGVKSDVIPERIITKAPSAELREDQKDEDSLPPYDVLDTILELFIEQEKSIDEVIEELGRALKMSLHGSSVQSMDYTHKACNDDIRETVRCVYKLLHSSEYKRRQSCPGVNITTKSFGGRSRRYPIVNRY